MCAEQGGARLKYLVVSLRPRSTGVFCPTACLMTQLPSWMRGMILNAAPRSLAAAASSPGASRNLAGETWVRTGFSRFHAVRRSVPFLKRVCPVLKSQSLCAHSLLTGVPHREGGVNGQSSPCLVGFSLYYCCCLTQASHYDVLPNPQ